jgi:hypothetical protein
LALQWLPNTPPDTIAIFSPNRIVPRMKGLALPHTANHRKVVSQVRIDRFNQARLGHQRATILYAGHLADGMNARICPAGKVDWANLTE